MRLLRVILSTRSIPLFALPVLAHLHWTYESFFIFQSFENIPKNRGRHPHLRARAIISKGRKYSVCGSPVGLPTRRRDYFNFKLFYYSGIQFVSVCP